MNEENVAFMKHLGGGLAPTWLPMEERLNSQRPKVYHNTARFAATSHSIRVYINNSIHLVRKCARIFVADIVCS